MTIQFSDIARQAAADGVITADEILALRRDGWGDGQVTLDEADAIFAIDAALAERSPEWCDFFVEAIGEYVLNAWEPKGYVTDTQAAWLIGKIAADGELGSLVELEVLLRLLERAANVPDALKTFALEQIERAVMIGSGPTRDGGALSGGCVSAAECRALRRAIFAVGGDRPAAVSRREAEMLFRIKDATLGAANAPEWKPLFVQGVGNYLMGYASPDAQLSRDRAAELDAFMADRSTSIGRFMGRMARGVPGGFRAVFGRKGTDIGRDERVVAAHQVTGEEDAWLEAQLHANGEVDEYDRALLAFIAEETGSK
jgi:hypothetical protein